jgi:hypothetical protein
VKHTCASRGFLVLGSRSFREPSLYLLGPFAALSCRSKWKMIGGKDALSDPFGVAHEGAHWVWSIIPMGRKPNGYQVQVSARGFLIIALL